MHHRVKSSYGGPSVNFLRRPPVGIGHSSHDRRHPRRLVEHSQNNGWMETVRVRQSTSHGRRAVLKLDYQEVEWLHFSQLQFGRLLKKWIEEIWDEESAVSRNSRG
ncbi:hypothetical protein TNCV_727971 [Trichonephila clavipes]|nr:hypothetical protein TNCV_727971 [Trichonephila clavipes]